MSAYLLRQKKKNYYYFSHIAFGGHHFELILIDDWGINTINHKNKIFTRTIKFLEQQ